MKNPRGKRGSGEGTLFRRIDAEGNPTGAWLAKYTEHDDAGNILRRRTRSTKTTDRAKAERILARWLREELERLADPLAFAAKIGQSLTIEEALERWEIAKRSEGRTGKHIDASARDIRTIAAYGNWKAVRDIEPHAVRRFVAALRAVPENEGRLSDRTIQRIIIAAKGFSRWCEREGLAASDALKSVTAPRAGESNRTRRMLGIEEWPWLAQAAMQGPARLGMPGEHRAVLYAFTLATGLRVSEIASLRVESVIDEGDAAFVRLRASAAKNRTEALFRLPTPLIGAMRTLIGKRGQTAPLFHTLPRRRERIARILREDLASARERWIADAPDANTREDRERSGFLLAQNGEGWVDFHALRLTAGNWQRLAGASTKEQQEFMRHSTPELTLNIYGRLTDREREAPAERLAHLLGLTTDAHEIGEEAPEGPVEAESNEADAEVVEFVGVRHGATAARRPARTRLYPVARPGRSTLRAPLGRVCSGFAATSRTSAPARRSADNAHPSADRNADNARGHSGIGRDETPSVGDAIALEEMPENPEENAGFWNGPGGSRTHTPVAGLRILSPERFDTDRLRNIREFRRLRAERLRGARAARTETRTTRGDGLSNGRPSRATDTAAPDADAIASDLSQLTDAEIAEALARHLRAIGALYVEQARRMAPRHTTDHRPGASPR